MATALLLQTLSDAYGSELGTVSSDEAAHFVSGLMVRDYLVGAIGAEPTGYALDYYSHYPKIAIGNWPPLFHGAEGLWMSVLPATVSSVLLLIAVASAATSLTVFLLLRRQVGTICAGFASAWFLILPPVPHYLGAVMAELPTVLGATLAICFWIRFLDSERARDALLFGGFTVLTVLTKSNGLFLLLVPPLSIFVSGRWRVLRSRPLWYTVLAVVLLAAPWTWLFLDTMREGWSSVAFSAEFTREALAYYPVQLVRQMGLAATATVAIGAWACLASHPWRNVALGATALSAVASVIVFHSVVPAGIGGRHLVLAYPSMIFLAAFGLRAMAVWLEPPFGSRTARVVVALAITAVVGAEVARLPETQILGYGAAAEVVRHSSEPESPIISLIASDPTGEGAYVVEAALRDPERPRDTVWRASKLLASATWAGRDYVLRAREEPELLRLLELGGVRWVVFDHSATPSPHLRLLDRTINAHPDRFRLRQEIPVRRFRRVISPGISVYQVVTPAGPVQEPALRQIPGYHGVAWRELP